MNNLLFCLNLIELKDENLMETMKVKYKSFPIILMALTLLFVACSGENQTTDSQIKKTKVETESSNTNSSSSDQLPETMSDNDLQFKEAVSKHVKTSWGTWAKGESIGRCFIANTESLDNETKEAVIEYGIEEAFDNLSGKHLQNLSKTWDLCESKATSNSTTKELTKVPTSSKTPSDTKKTTSSSVEMLDFESVADHQNFSEILQTQFQDAVDEHYDAATEKAGISVAVYKDNYLWRYAKGNSSSSDMMTAGTPVLVRSTSKTILAGLILQQIDEGLYSLSDTLDSVLSGNSDYQLLDKNIINSKVTIEQLLTMTSGIEDVNDYFRKEFTELQEDRNWEPIELIQLPITPFSQPGTYKYVNTNSNLLGLIAEHTGQRPLNELYQSKLFDPLGIVGVLLPQDAPPSNTARPHGDRSLWGGTGFGDISEVSHHSNWYQASGRTTWASAGIITTPENMAQWIYELLSNQGSAISPIARASLLESFSGPLIAIGGTKPEHQYGYHVTKTTLMLSKSSITAYGHPGSGGGYISDVFYSPELDLSISLVVNSHSNARSREEAQGKITHNTLGEIAREIFESYISK